VIDDIEELITKLGHTVQIAGIIYGDHEGIYLAPLPDEDFNVIDTVWLTGLDLEIWQRIIRQTDLMETEVLSKSSDGKLAKIIVRKANRQIEQHVAWAVYRRDDYRCRYCGRQDVPLTVDHLVLWEEGGPSIEENLVACCRKCNKARGNTQYEDWLRSPYYKRVSQGATVDHQLCNEAVADTLAGIPRKLHVSKR